jgi:hypothetical protein
MKARNKSWLFISAGALALGWIVVVGGVFGHLLSVKLFAVLEYWLISGSAFLVCLAVLRPLAFAFLAPVGYIGGMVSASFGRQVAYEIATAGHVTDLFDSCSAALLTFAQVGGFVVEIVLAGALAGAAAGSIVLFRLPQRWLYPALIVTSVAALTAGMIHGVTSWADWQPNRPCF